MLIAPSEPPALKAIGKSSSTPEKHGVDIMFATPGGIVGIQRKELADFFASVADGRLAREYPLMQTLSVAVLLIEGRQRWSQATDGSGVLINSHPSIQRSWSRNQFRAYMMSVQQRGIWVMYSDDLTDTIAVVQNLEKWAQKPTHHSLLTRPKPQGAWGRPESRDWNLHLAQSFAGIGPVQAERILDHFGGVLPISWTCTKAELGKVAGIGKMRLDQLWAALPENPYAPEIEIITPKPKRKKATA